MKKIGINHLTVVNDKWLYTLNKKEDVDTVHEYYERFGESQPLYNEDGIDVYLLKDKKSGMIIIATLIGEEYSPLTMNGD